METTNHTYTKTSLYLRDDLKEKIHKLAPKQKQSDFINQTLENTLKNLEKEMIKQELLKDLKSIKKIKSKTTAKQTLEKLRKQREKVLLGRLSK